MPSQQQVRWSQLRVGLTVIFASIVLAILIFLISGTTSIFTKNLMVHAYFDNAGGLRVGSPVRLNGVDIGNLSAIAIEPAHNPIPVDLVMKINSKFQKDLPSDALVTIATEGVIGGAYVDIDATQAKGPPVTDNAILKTKDRPDIMDVVRSSQTTLQNVQTLVQRVDRIVSSIESGQGSIGKLIYDPSLYNRLNLALGQVQAMVNDISSGKGSIGKLLYSDDVYNKLNAALDNVNKIVDDINAGKGSAGKFLKDEALYKNANDTIAKANALMTDINAGKGAIGLMAKDEEFRKKLDNTLDRVSKIADRMEAGEGSVGKLLKDPSLYNNVDQMTVEMRDLVKAIRENPKKYLVIHLKVF